MKRLNLYTLVLSSALLAACNGGGDSGSSAPASDNNGPNAGMDNSNDSDGASNSVSGSLARLITLNGHLYTFTGHNHSQERFLTRLTVDDTGALTNMHQISVGWEPETLTHDGNYLYVGSPSAVEVYGFDENSGFQYIERATHNWGRDPVITDGKYVYSTVAFGELNDYNGNFIDPSQVTAGELMVFEWNDAKTNLTPIGQYGDVGYVKGLTLVNDNLLICDGLRGLIQFDTSNPYSLTKVSEHDSVKCHDPLHLAYVNNGHIAAVGDAGIHQLQVHTDRTVDELSFYDASVNGVISEESLASFIGTSPTLINDPRSCDEKLSANDPEYSPITTLTFNPDGTVDLLPGGDIMYRGNYELVDTNITVTIPEIPTFITSLKQTNQALSFVDNNGRLYFTLDNQPKCEITLEQKLAASTWQLDQVIEGSDIHNFEDNQVTFSFDTVTKKIDGNIICNIASGGYSIEGSNLSITDLSSTEIYCGDDTPEFVYPTSEVFNTSLTEGRLTLASESQTYIFSSID